MEGRPETRMETGDRVQVQLERGKWHNATLGRTDHHRIEWFVHVDGERRARFLAWPKTRPIEPADVNGDVDTFTFADDVTAQPVRGRHERGVAS